MGEASERYLYSNLIEDLRAGRALPAGVGADLDVYPAIDGLRAAVRDSEVATLLASATGVERDCGAGGEPAARFRGAPRRQQRVAQAVVRFGGVHGALRAALSPARRFPVAARMESGDLAFTKQHRHEFVQASAQWAGGAERILQYVASRLADPSFPRSKAWVYLIIATPSRDSAVRLVSIYAKTDDFTGAVARELLG